MAGVTQTVPQAVTMAARSLLLEHFWQAPDIELFMSDIAAIFAISDAMLPASTVDRLRPKVTKTASIKVSNRRADE